MRYLVQETTGSSLPTGGAERGHRWSQLITLCLTGIMIPSSSLLFCGLVSVFLVYSLDPKVEGALATDYSSSILYYPSFFLNEEREVRMAKSVVKILGSIHTARCAGFSRD